MTKLQVRNTDFLLRIHIGTEASQVALVVKNSQVKAGRHKRPGSDPSVRKIPLEKEMAPPSSILAWRIPWTEEPGGLQFITLQRVNTTEAT